MIRNRNIQLSSDKFFGPLPNVATGSLVTPAVKNEGAVVYDATANVLKFSTGAGGSWTSVGTGSTTLVGLTDTPSNYTAAAKKLVAVNAAANAVEFVATTITPGADGFTLAGGTTARSVQVTGSNIVLTGGGNTLTLGGNLTTATANITLTATAGGSSVVLPASGNVIAAAGAAAQGEVLYYTGTAWARLGVGTAGYYLKTQGASANPIWDQPSAGTASVIAQSSTIECGASDYTLSASAPAATRVLTIADPGGADTFAYLAATQTFTNKTLTSPKIGTSILDTNGAVLFALTATGTAVNYLTYANAADGGKLTLTATGSSTHVSINLVPKGANGRVELNSQTVNLGGALATAGAVTFSGAYACTLTLGAETTATLPSGTVTLVARNSSDTLSTKTMSAADNTFSNFSAAEMKEGTVGTDLDLIPFIISKDVSNAATTVIFDSDAPYKFLIINAWVVNTSAGNTGTWKLDDGTNDITTAINYTASDTALVRATSIDDDYHEIAADGSLRCINSVDTDDAVLYVMAIRVPTA